MSYIDLLRKSAEETGNIVCMGLDPVMDVLPESEAGIRERLNGYFSEIFRGGIESIPRGQKEAGQVLGMTGTQIFFKVTLLQVIKRIVPPMGNEIITLVKDTSLVRVISVYEVMWNGQAFIKSSGLIWPLFFTAVYYLAFNGLLTILFGWLEKKLDYFKV